MPQRVAAPLPMGWSELDWEGGAPFLPSPFPFPFLPSYSYYLEGLLVLLGKGESYSRWE